MTRLRKYLAAALILALALALAGCGMFEARMAGAAMNMQKLQSARADVSADLDMRISMFGSAALSSQMNVDVNGTAEFIREPLKGKLDLNIALEDNDTAAMQAFLESVNGDLLLYFSPDGGASWRKFNPQSGSLAAPDLNFSPETLEWLAKVASTFEETGTETVKGSEAVVYSGIVKWDDLVSAADLDVLAAQLSGMLGVTVSGSDLNLGSAGDVPVTICVDKDNGMVTKCTIDLTGPLHALMPFVKDLAMDIIKQQGGLGGAASFAGSFLNVGLDVDRCLVSVELYDFDGVGDVDIPDAARNAPVSTGVSVR